MKSKKSFWILALVFVLLLAGATILYNKLSAQQPAENLAAQETQDTESAASQGDSSEVQPAILPDFTVLDGEGNQVSLHGFFGKPVILNFWASWCGPCKSEMPAFEDAYQAYGDEINFVMINVTDGSRETMEDAKAYIQEQGYTFPVYYDTELDASITYGASAIPTTYFIDAEGYGVAYAMSALSRETLQTGIDMIYSAE